MNVYQMLEYMFTDYKMKRNIFVSWLHKKQTSFISFENVRNDLKMIDYDKNKNENTLTYETINIYV